MNYKGNTHLKWEDRLTLERMLKINTPKPKIAEALGVCVKTVYNEIARGMCEQITSELEHVQRYCADVAERKYQEHLREKGPDIKLGKDFAFAEYIEEQIIEKRGPPARRWRKLRLTGYNSTHIFVKRLCITGYTGVIYS